MAGNNLDNILLKIIESPDPYVSFDITIFDNVHEVRVKKNKEICSLFPHGNIQKIITVSINKGRYYLMESLHFHLQSTGGFFSITILGKKYVNCGIYMLIKRQGLGSTE